MRVAVTGATGFVGRHVVDQLSRRGHTVRGLARTARGARLLAARGADAVPGELADSTALHTLLRGADAAVHLVGIIVESGGSGGTFAAVHADGTRRVLEAARDMGVRRMVHMSAVGARPDPSATPYHRTKWQAEEFVRSSGLRAAIFRPSLINGPENAPVRTLARAHRWSPVVPVFGDGRFPTQPVWIEDVALAFALAVERPDLVGTFELGGPDVLTFEEFVRAIGRASGHPRPLIHVPLGVVRLAARLSNPLGRAAPITSDQLRMLVEGTATPANAIESVFGIKPLSFEDGLRRFLGEGGRGKGGR
ncbi:MAG: hypothetical protein DMD49_12320 [Gemmatimonadetes bacterium]|nr:MAG: hypothetical protein DMD49_12320 [Gemmatimonadota bacterium]